MQETTFQQVRPEPDFEPVDLQLGAARTEPFEASVRLPAALARTLSEASARAGHELEATLLAALTVVISKCTGLRDFVIKRVVVAGAASSVPIRVAPDGRFDEQVGQVAGALRAADATYAPCQPDDLVFRMLDGHSPVDAASVSSATVFQVRVSDAALELSARAPVALDRRYVLASILSAYAHVLEQCSADYRARIRGIRLAAGDARAQLLDTLNRTQTPFQPRPIQAIFEEQVGLHPERLAVHDGRTSLTYLELNRRANRVASALRARGVERNAICGILVDRSVDWCVALLGILKAGGAFLPIDASYPQERIDLMLRTSGCRFVLAQTQYFDRVGSTVECCDVEALALGGGVDANPELRSTPSDLAYVIYTSGSTGIPKGVPIAHEGIASFDQHYKNSFHFTPDDNVLNFFSPSFDGSISELTMALLAGTGFYILPEEIKGSYRRFEQYLNEHCITVATIPPPYLRYLEPAAFRTLHTIFVAGSESTKSLVEAWTSRYSIVNHYGPTEVTICASEWKAPKGSVPYASVPIGRPIANKKVYVLNDDLELQPFGVRGELCVSGVRMSAGYLNPSSQTTHKFLPNPFASELADGSQHPVLYRTGDSARWFEDGNLEFLGRIDDQVKVRGYRVELGEIEQVMLSLPGVRQATVIATPDDSGETGLYGFVAAGPEITEQDLRAHLMARLPSFMLPSRLLRLEVMPLTGSDKVDKKQLAALLRVAPDRANDGVSAADDSDEITRSVLQFIRTSCEVRSEQPVEFGDDLESLGINSLRFIKLIMQIEDRFGFEVEGEFFVGRRGLTVGDIVRETQRRVALP